MPHMSAIRPRTSPVVPVLLAAVFLLSCFASVAHDAMAGDQGCQAPQTSVKMCGQAMSPDMPPVLSTSAPGLSLSLAPGPGVTLALPPAGLAEHHAAPVVPRSPPLVLP
jgi:hypothetical protein